MRRGALGQSVRRSPKMFSSLGNGGMFDETAYVAGNALVLYMLFSRSGETARGRSLRMEYSTCWKARVLSRRPESKMFGGQYCKILAM